MADQIIVAIKYDPTSSCGEGFIEGSDLCRFAEVFRNPHSVLPSLCGFSSYLDGWGGGFHAKKLEYGVNAALPLSFRLLG